jgi:hypothetical protein
MSVQSRAFLRLFSDEVRSSLVNPEDTRRRWNSSPEWSALMLGSAESRRNADFGVLGRIGRSLGYALQAEYLRVDQIWYTLNPDAPEGSCSAETSPHGAFREKRSMITMRNRKPPITGE